MPTALLIKDAITAALASDWNRAIDLNEQILKESSYDIDTLNRLAFAYTQTGDVDKAKKVYKKIFSLDRYNFIAQKNFEKLSGLPSKVRGSKLIKSHPPIQPHLFLEEPGRTKAVHLIHPAPLSILSKLRVGTQVYLYPKKHSVEIRDEEKSYLGALPDDIAFRLIHFLKMGNTYVVYIKNILRNGISVFIKEMNRGKRLHNQPTFQPSSFDYPSSSPRELKINADSANGSDEDQSTEDE